MIGSAATPTWLKLQPQRPTMTEGVPWNAFSDEDGAPSQPAVLGWNAWNGGHLQSAAKSARKDAGENNSWAVFEERAAQCGESGQDETGGAESEWQDFAQERSFSTPVKTVAESSGSSGGALTSACHLQIAPSPSLSSVQAKLSCKVFRTCFQCSLVPPNAQPERQPFLCHCDSRCLPRTQCVQPPVIVCLLAEMIATSILILVYTHLRFLSCLQTDALSVPEFNWSHSLMKDQLLLAHCALSDEVSVTRSSFVWVWVSVGVHLHATLT